MRIEEILKTVQFVVDQEGKPKAAVLDMRAWEICLRCWKRWKIVSLFEIG
jgi:hypothetical protein